MTTGSQVPTGRFFAFQHNAYMEKRDMVPGLAKLLKAARGRAKLSQDEAATAAGVHRISITRYETGVVTPTLAVLIRLARAYGVKAGELLPDNPPEKKLKK